MDDWDRIATRLTLEVNYRRPTQATECPLCRRVGLRMVDPLTGVTVYVHNVAASGWVDKFCCDEIGGWDG